MRVGRRTIYGYRDNLRGILLLCSVSRIIVICFPLGPMAWLTTGCWPSCLSCGSDFKSNQKVIDYSPNICATLSLVSSQGSDDCSLLTGVTAGSDC